MKKRLKIVIITMTLCLIGTNSSFAQVAIRADAGIIGYRTFSRNPSQAVNISGFGAQLGADYDMHIAKSFYLTSGLYWSYRMAVIDVPEVYGLEHLKEHLLNVPVHAKWRFDIRPAKFGINIYIGPVFSLGMSSRSNFDMRISMMKVDGTYNYFNGEVHFNTLSGRSSDKLGDMIKDELDAVGLKYNRFEARLDSGIGFVIRGRHEIVTGCDCSLNNRLKGDVAEDNYMIVSNIYAGYRYRFGKTKH